MGVVRTAWTPDSQFFVYTLTSSGGHQPWYCPTLFYSRRKNAVRLLDDYVGGAILSHDFELRPTDTLSTWRMGKDYNDWRWVTVKLSRLELGAQ